MAELSRVRPDPIPKIDPIPEHLATGALAETYARTREGLGVPWMGVVAMAFARYPTFYETLWSAMVPMLASRDFAEACRDLRREVEINAAALCPRGLLSRLRERGYTSPELDDIRACNEVFSAGNMPYMLMASLARLMLEGQNWTGPTAAHAGQTRASGAPKPVLIEPHHADPTMAALYSDIRVTLGLPFVNTDYRAFARWPSYFVLAWQDLKAALTSDSYDIRVTSVHEHALAIARGLPIVSRLDAGQLREAAAKDAPLDDVLAVVRLFQWVLPGLATNVAFFRAQIHRG